jgi:hypothetical protein
MHRRMAHSEDIDDGSDTTNSTMVGVLVSSGSDLSRPQTHLSFHLAEDRPARIHDDYDGNLVIDTDSQQLTGAMNLSAQALDPVSSSSILQSLRLASSDRANGTNFYVITDPAQIQAITNCQRVAEERLEVETDSQGTILNITEHTSRDSVMSKPYILHLSDEMSGSFRVQTSTSMP